MAMVLLSPRFLQAVPQETTSQTLDGTVARGKAAAERRCRVSRSAHQIKFCLATVTTVSLFVGFTFRRFCVDVGFAFRRFSPLVGFSLRAFATSVLFLAAPEDKTEDRKFSLAEL